jgi:hypothetical protein
LVGKTQEKRQLGRHTRIWEDNIKIDLGEIGFADVVWINWLREGSNGEISSK